MRPGLGDHWKETLESALSSLQSEITDADNARQTAAAALGLTIDATTGYGQGTSILDSNEIDELNMTRQVVEALPKDIQGLQGKDEELFAKLQDAYIKKA